ncbi:hypothetical protein ACEPAH_5844 [Sanghuangporus vaninii]
MASADSSLCYIRPVQPSDAPALSRICLLTGDAGKSAEGLHSIPELIGLFYACPYVSLPHTGGFVLARRRPLDPPDSDTRGEQERHISEEDVLGYTLFAYDTRAFEEAAERDWFPPLRAKYPKPVGGAWETVYDRQLTDADKRYIKLLHSPDRAPKACIAFSPAHLHIDILPEAQRQGWGRRLIESAVRYLRDEKSLSGVWLGMDPRNVDAARFYERLGFQSIECAPGNCMGLMFENWRMN